MILTFIVLSSITCVTTRSSRRYANISYTVYRRVGIYRGLLGDVKLTNSTTTAMTTVLCVLYQVVPSYVRITHAFALISLGIGLSSWGWRLFAEI